MKDKKQMRYFKVDYHIDWDNESLDRVERDIAELRKRGATHIEISNVETHYGGHVEYTVMAYREETDEEQEDRLAKIAAHTEATRQRELAYLEQLKQKYE